MSRYIKAIIALLGGVSAWGITAVSDGSSISAAELFGLLGVLATSLGVYAFPNQEETFDEAGVTLVELCVLVIAVVFVLWALGVVPSR